MILPLAPFPTCPILVTAIKRRAITKQSVSMKDDKTDAYRTLAEIFHEHDVTVDWVLLREEEVMTVG
jgi:hypothetical protein